MPGSERKVRLHVRLAELPFSSDCISLGDEWVLVKDKVSISIFQTLNEFRDDHCHSALTAVSFLCINLDINTSPQTLLYD